MPIKNDLENLHAPRWWQSVKCFCAVLTISLTVGLYAAEPGKDEEAVRIYQESCAACHSEGAVGAPRPGVSSDWVSRMAYGVDGLYLSVIEGIVPQMPARGMCLECSDSQLMAVVDFMVQDLEPAREREPQEISHPPK